MIGRRRALIAALVAAVPLTIVGGAAATPAVAGTLTGFTTITWTGVKGISLSLPDRAVSLPAQRMKLIVGNDATYALVRLLPTRTQQGCPGGRVCNIWSLDYFRAYEDRVLYPPDWDPADRHSTLQSDPPVLRPGGRLELYLFTDGTASVQLLPVGLTGASDYVAAGQIHGVVRKLAASCPTPACSTSSGYADRFSFGGSAFDLGPLGSVEVWALSLAERPSLLTVQSSPIRVCVYPGNVGASPDPGRHPLGCDPVPTSVKGADEELFLTAEEIDWALPGYDGVVLHYFPSSLSGRQYAGYHIGSVGTSRQIRAAYGIWYRYGIPGAPAS